MTLTLPQELVDEMVAHARDDLPNECCGIIARDAAGALTLYRAANDAASPYRFDIPAQQLLHLFRAIEDSSGDFLVIYHSHVASPARPLAHRPAHGRNAPHRRPVALLGARLAARRRAIGPRLAHR